MYSLPPSLFRSAGRLIRRIWQLILPQLHLHGRMHLRRVVGPLTRCGLPVAINQEIDIQPRTPHDIVAEPFGPGLGSLVPVFRSTDITILRGSTGGLVIAHDLWEDADAFEAAFRVRTHVVKTEIDGLVVDVHGEPFEDLLGAVEADGVGVGAGGALGEVHDPRGVLVHLHVRYAAKVDAVLGRGGGGVVLHQHAAGVAVLRLGGAVAQPDEIPAVTVGRERLGGFGSVEEGLGAESDALELGAEIDVPVGVVFHDQGGRKAFVDDFMGEIHVAAPAANDAVFALTFIKHLLGLDQHLPLPRQVRLMKLTPERALAGTSAPLTPGMTLKLKPVTEEASLMASSLSVLPAMLRT